MKRVRRELQSVLAERQVKSNKFVGDNNFGLSNVSEGYKAACVFRTYF